MIFRVVPMGPVGGRTHCVCAGYSCFTGTSGGVVALGAISRVRILVYNRNVVDMTKRSKADRKRTDG